MSGVHPCLGNDGVLLQESVTVTDDELTELTRKRRDHEMTVADMIQLTK